jgi:hypothetical protein
MSCSSADVDLQDIAVFRQTEKLQDFNFGMVNIQSKHHDFASSPHRIQFICCLAKVDTGNGKWGRMAGFGAGSQIRTL